MGYGDYNISEFSSCRRNISENCLLIRVKAYPWHVCVQGFCY